MKRFSAAATALGMIIVSVMARAEAPVDYRLPPSIHPTGQSVELRLDPALLEYRGSTSIDITVEQASERIGIYQVAMHMPSITLAGQGVERTLTPTAGEWDMVWLADGKPIAPGDYQLRIEFSGPYATDSLGMHRVHFEDNDYVFTQFEAMHARRAFPVFDEPAFKIPYQLTINAPVGLTVVSNTPVAARSEADGWQRVEFMQTRPIPSYLVAYAVGPLDSVPITGMSVPGRIYTPKGRAGEVGFVARETPKILKALENYFGTSYHYRKLDLLAVPEFAFGAMENPGLVTFRTDLLMVGDKPVGSQAAGVLGVVAHELAHQWYGDLVTLRWWNDMWLNESFATWMGNRVMESVYPQYETELDLPQAGAFPIDELVSAKPVRKPIRVEDDIFEDLGLAYNKGHSILSVVEAYTGPEVFQAAVRDYLKRYAWGNATEQDLWSVISEHGDADVSAIAARYLNQAGFPLVSVDDQGKVTQTRYQTFGRVAPPQQWLIPLAVKYKQDGVIKQTFTLLDKQTGSLDIPADVEWLFPDAGANGYYRWKIDPVQFQRLVRDVDALANREKIALLDNSEALLNAGEMSLADYLMVLNRTLADPHPLVFRPALNALEEIGDDFIDAANAEAFSRFVDRALDGRLDAIGLEPRPGEAEGVTQVRPKLVSVLGQFGSDEETYRQIGELAHKYLADPDSVPSDLGKAALSVNARHGDRKEYEAYRKAYKNAQSESMKSNLLSSMYFTDPEIIKEHLDWSLSDAVPAGEASWGLYMASYVLDDYGILYTWLDENLDALLSKLPPVYHHYLPLATASTCNQANLDKLVAFYQPRSDIYQAYLAKSVENIENCIARKQRESAALESFLQGYAK